MTDNLTPQPSDQSLVRFQSRAPELLQQVREISVIDDVSYVQTCEYKLAAKALLNTLETITDQIKLTQQAARDAALTPWERIMAPIAEAEALAERKRKEYRDVQERKQQEQHAEAMRVARETAEAEQKRNAELLAAAGHQKAAEQVRNAPLQVAAVVPLPAVPKVKGIRNVKTWKVKITDPNLFVRAVGAALLLQMVEADTALPWSPGLATFLRTFADGVPPDALAALVDPNGESVGMHWLRDRAKQQREAFKVPGVSAWQE